MPLIPRPADKVIEAICCDAKGRIAGSAPMREKSPASRAGLGFGASFSARNPFYWHGGSPATAA
jgi:hypothetical protein